MNTIITQVTYKYTSCFVKNTASSRLKSQTIPWKAIEEKYAALFPSKI